MEDEAAKGHIFIAFRQVEREHLVDLLNLQSGREHVLVVGELLRHKVGVVVLILYLAGYLLHDVLQRHKTAGSAEFIDNDSQRALLLHQLFHELRGEHRLGHERNGAHNLQAP